MGGGRSSADQTNQTVNTNTVADNGAVAIGQGGSYETNSIIGNTGTVLGAGANLTMTGLDQHSYDLLDQAQTLSYDNTTNFLKFLAAQNQTDPSTITADIQPTTSDRAIASTVGGLKMVVIIVVIALVGLFIFGRRKKK